jgi:hypothetical protein
MEARLLLEEDLSICRAVEPPVSHGIATSLIHLGKVISSANIYIINCMYRWIVRSVEPFVSHGIATSLIHLGKVISSANIYNKLYV